MNTYLVELVSLLKGIPAWTEIVCPALLLVVGLGLAVGRAKKAYLPVAVALGGAELFLFACVGEGTAAVLAGIGVYLVWSVLVSLLLLIPFRGRKRESAEEIYQKFHVGLEDGEVQEMQETQETVKAPGAEGVHPEYALSLIRRLREKELTAGDRLETDSLATVLGDFCGRELTAEETETVNDALASVLRLAAKYSL